MPNSNKLIVLRVYFNLSIKNKQLTKSLNTSFKNVNELLKRINSDAKYSDEPEVYTEVVNTLNNILDESSILAKSRKTRSGNNGEEKVMAL